MSANCPMHLAEQPQGQHPMPHDFHKCCQLCGLCMPMAAIEPMLPSVFAEFSQLVPESFHGRFVSADLTQDVKPPIS